MNRMALYFILLIIHGLFWTVILFANYLDYTSFSPDILNEPMGELFDQNRGNLFSAELVFPFLLALSSFGLIFVKIRLWPVRGVFLFLLFLGLEYWIWRTFFFPDRMATYFEVSNTGSFWDRFAEPHRFLLIGYALFGLIPVIFRELEVAETDFIEETEEVFAMKEAMDERSSPHPPRVDD